MGINGEPLQAIDCAHVVLTGENCPGIMRKLSGEADTRSDDLEATKGSDKALQANDGLSARDRYESAVLTLKAQGSPELDSIREYVRQLRDRARQAERLGGCGGN